MILIATRKILPKVAVGYACFIKVIDALLVLFGWYGQTLEFNKKTLNPHQINSLRYQ